MDITTETGTVNLGKYTFVIKFCEPIIELPEVAPSRAYLKIAQACSRFKITSNKKLNWIEFGSSPGGASYYLLENFNKVVGVDPAQMDSLCLNNNKFIQLNHLNPPNFMVLYNYFIS